MKVPKPRKLPSGNWFIQLRLGGESVPITESTEKKCIHTAEVIKAEYRAGKREKAIKTDLTLCEAIDKYIDARSNALSPSTIQGYHVIRNNRFQGVMDKPLHSISDWQKICNDEAKTCSAKTLKNAWLFVASVIRETTRQSTPRITLPQIVRRERPYLDPEQILLFIRAIEGQECEIPALLALHSLRRSEICALTWDKIDLKRKRIKISGAAVFDENQKLIQKKTNKNQSSQRDVPIMIPELSSALLDCGDKKGIIIACNPNTIWAQINRICRNNGLPEVGVHGLRHSFASLAYHLSVPEKTAMQIGGWSDNKTMHNIYTHLAQKDITRYETELSKFFENANKKANS